MLPVVSGRLLVVESASGSRRRHLIFGAAYGAAVAFIAVGMWLATRPMLPHGYDWLLAPLLILLSGSLLRKLLLEFTVTLSSRELTISNRWRRQTVLLTDVKTSALSHRSIIVILHSGRSIMLEPPIFSGHAEGQRILRRWKDALDENLEEQHEALP